MSTVTAFTGSSSITAAFLVIGGIGGTGAFTNGSSPRFHGEKILSADANAASGFTSPEMISTELFGT